MPVENLPEISGQVTELQEEIINNEVVDQSSYEKAAFIKQRLSLLKKHIKEKFAPMLKKAHETHKEIKSQEKSYLEPVEKAERELLTKCKQYENKVEEERIKAKKELEEQLKKEEEPTVEWDKPEEKQIEVPQLNKVSGLGIRRVWKFKITNESLLPREYLVPDERKIRAEVTKNKENTKIPGVEAFKE